MKSFRLADICWNSRTQVCDDLLTLLECRDHPDLQDVDESYHDGDTYHSRSTYRRYVAVTLVSHLADASHGTRLSTLFLDSHLEKGLRHEFIPALVRAQVRLPARSFARLFRSEVWLGPEDEFELVPFLQLFSPEMATRRLLSVNLQEAGWAKPLLQQLLQLRPVDWETLQAELYGRWLDGGLGDFFFGDPYTGETDVLIAAAMPDDPRAQARLHTYRQQSELTPIGTLPCGLWPDADENGRAVDWDAYSPLAGRLALPLAGLVQVLSPAGLAERLEEELRAASRRYHAGDTVGGHTPAYSRTLQLVRECPPEVPQDGLINVLLCPDTHRLVRSYLRSALLDRCWRFNPDGLRQDIRQVFEQEHVHSSVGSALRWMSEDPRPEDTSLFWWALDGPKPEYRYRGIRGLCGLNESRAKFLTRLEELAVDSDAVVRVAARGALLHLGQEERLTELAQALEADPDECARAEAARILSDWDRDAFIPHFARLLVDSPPLQESNAPHCEEAAYQLALAATPDSLAALVRGAIMADWRTCWVVTRYYLPQAMARWEKGTPVTEQHWDWRIYREWEWRCA